LQIEYGGQCHISGRPYTVFRWRPGNDARYKKTIICQDVAKAKNVCQVCLLDLDYNLPVQVRDKALGMQEEVLPESVPGKEFALKRMADAGELDDRSKFDTTGPNELLAKLQRTQPHYKRNQARICSFFVRGECKRGAECPYRHEMPTTGPLANQNIKDRYYGTNDPVAEKMLSRAQNLQGLTPPEDRSIMTLYVGGLGPTIEEDDLKDVFYPYGELKSVRKVAARNCAFVTYTTREAAETAAAKLANQLVVKGERLKLMWGKPQAPKEGGNAQGGAGAGAGAGAQFARMPTPGQAAQMYPSMDPLQAGTRTAIPEKRRVHGEEEGRGENKRSRPPPLPVGQQQQQQQPEEVA
jgi:pre-mRNA-splicing factor RBM22/SLT11